MPLLDHFHEPLKKVRHWEGFHSAWANMLVRQLNGGVLPRGFIAEPHIRLGVQVEGDVVTFEEETGAEEAATKDGRAIYAPPQPALTLPLDWADLELFEI